MRPVRFRRLLLPAISLFLFLACLAGSAPPQSRETLGIAPQDEGYYKANVIKCRDGSRKFTKDQLNDDFCDCPDGTDEPGTSACPEGKFYCRNMGHTPVTIFSSRVNDGICDCCDGSDEYDGKVKCLNTCWEAGKVARERLKKKIATFQEGVIIRKQEVAKAADAFAKDEDDLSKLRNEEKGLRNLVQKLKEQKEQIEKAEELERKKREEEEQRQKESEKKDGELEKQLEEPLHNETKSAPGPEVQPESFDQDTIENVDDFAIEDEEDPLAAGQASPSEHVAEEQVLQDQGDTGLEVSARNEEVTSHEAAKEEQKVPANTEGLTKEELGRIVASRWTGENVDNKADDGDSSVKQETHKDDVEFPESAEGEDSDGYNSETDEDHHKYGDDVDDDFEDRDIDSQYKGEHVEPENFTTSSSPSWLEKIQETCRNILHAINLFKTPVDLSDAARVRKEYDDASSKLSTLQSKISSLSEKLKHDFGKEKAFYSFYDNCFELKESKYVYKVCPFKEASQVEGYSTTRLGRWDKFEEAYRVMQFSNGDRCWNGPDRSLRVRLRCGLKNELADVDEPSRCEYVAILSTPAVCVEEKLQELQNKLQSLNSGQQSTHDEL